MRLKALLAALATAALLVVPAASANEARVLDSEEDEIIIELATDDYLLEEFTVGGESFVRVEAPGYDRTDEAGLPSLPRKAVLVGVPFGARLALDVLSVESENLGRQRVAPTPAEEIRLAGDVSTPVMLFTIDDDFYARGGGFPAAVAELGAQGTLRHQRVVRVVLNPFQYSGRTGDLTLHGRVVVRISIEEERREPDLVDALRDEPEWNRVYERTVLNHRQAAQWRMRSEPGRAAMRKRSRSEVYRIFTSEPGMHRLDFTELSSEGLDDTTPIDEVAVFQRSCDPSADIPIIETPLAIVVVDADDDGLFDGDDYVLFHAQSFEQQFMEVGYEDRYGSVNAYWFARDDELALRMSTRPGWLDETGLEVPASFRDTVRFEEDVYFHEKPEDDFLDLYLWTNHWDAGDDHRLPFALHDVHPGSEARMRARYQGVMSGVHYLDFRIAHGDTADNYVGQFSFSGISENMQQHIYTSGSFPSWYFTDGDHTLRATGSRGSGANLDWFEFEYDREFAARDRRLRFTSAGETGVSQLEVGGFGSDSIRLFDVTDPLGKTELVLGPENISGGGADYTLTLQDDISGYTRYEASEDGGYLSAVSVERREPANLWESEADVIVVSHDDFASGVEPLVAHREAEGWLVEHALISEVYDEYGGGLKSLAAIKNYFTHSAAKWSRQPQFVLLVGDASEDTRGLDSSSQPDFIPTLLGHGSPSYPQMTASDQWFVSSDEAPLYLPQMFLGRLSVSTNAELDNLVSKILAYENYAATDYWRNNTYYIADDQWHYGTWGSSYRWDWDEHEFTDVSVELSEMVDSSPAGVDTTLFMMRRFTDAFHESNGVNHGSEPWEYYSQEVYPFVRSELSPLLVSGLSEGASLVNFQGHGNRAQMTHEMLFAATTNPTLNDVQSLTNDSKPFIFMGFSCHLAQFHSSNEGAIESIVEQMLFLPSGRGAVAGFACSGAAYLSDNSDYNVDIYEAFFDAETPGGSPSEYLWPRWSLGSILLEGTINFLASEGHSRPDRSYVLLGDPMLHLETSPPTMQVTVNGAALLSGEYLEPGDDPVTFVVDIIDEVEMDPASIAVEDYGGVVSDELYTVEAVGDTMGELGRWYRLTYETVIQAETYDIRISATDLNGQTGVFVVHVAGSDQITIDRVVNVPNPFHDTTKIIFQLNQSGADVAIDIYTVGGRRIATLEAFGELNYNEVEWDGVDGDGDLVANGLYLYVVEARGEDDSVATSDVGRIVVARGPRFDKPAPER